MAAPKARAYTIDEYLTKERAARERHVFVDGEIFAMAGESDAHGIITVNIVGTFHLQSKGTPCQARSKDTKVRSGRTPLPGHSISGMFSYPHVLVICGEVEHHDAFKDVVLNPTTIVEVLSPATEAFDRGDKFTTRREGGKWEYCRYAGLETSVSLPSIQCTLKLADVYDRVQFPAAE
jgi:Uma2 family endonuclease